MFRPMIFLALALCLSLAACQAADPLHDLLARPMETGQDDDASPQGALTNTGGYASKLSVAPGESLSFHISNSRRDAYSLTVYREGATREFVTTIPNVRTRSYNCAGKSATGCEWPAAVTFTVPADWPSGIYTVDIPRTATATDQMLFFVREANPGGAARMVFLGSVNTWNAYNDFGGASLYGFGGSEKAQQVSFDRPFDGRGLGLFTRWEQPFVRWAEGAGYPMAYATTSDLEFIPDLLAHYDVAIIAGHSEYWSWAMRQQVKEFVARGGRFVNLSGNTMWWQVRFEDNGRTMIGYKNWRDDPVQTREGATDLNWDYPIFDPSFNIIGLHWPYGGYPGSTGDGYYAVNTGHWLYTGTNLRENDLFGKGPTRATSIHDKESDGLAFNCAADGTTILGPISATGTPRNFTILGLTPVNSKQRDMDGVAMMGLYTTPAGGAVFSAGTTGWSLGLDQPAVDRITRNVLDRFLSGNFPQEPAAADADVFFRDRFNCANLSRGRFTSNAWQEDAPKLNYVEVVRGGSNRLTAACGYDGSGLELRMDNGSRYVTNLTTDWSGTPTLATRVYLNLRGLSLAEGATVELFQQSADDRRTSPPVPVASLQLGRRDGRLVVRYQPAGGNLPWAVVPADRFFLLETAWDRANNLVVLKVDGQRRVAETVDLSATPLLNRADFGAIAVAGGGGGAICVDELVYDLPVDEPPPPPPPSSDKIYLSFAQDGAIGDIAYGEEDILIYAPQAERWFPYFDGSDVGLGGVDVDAFAFLPDGSLLLSVDRTMSNIAGQGRITDADLLRFVPTRTGDETAGTLSLYLDGSDLGLESGSEDIDALAVLPDGRLLLSTLGSFRVGARPHLLPGMAQDVLALSLTQTGEDSAGAWSLYLDASDVGLSGPPENVDGLWLTARNDIVLSVAGRANAGGLTFGPSDLARCAPTALGDASACAFDLYWAGATANLANPNIDDVAIVLAGDD